jgi:CxxC motif-containing protein
MRENIELTCIGCPMGCALEVTLEDKKVIEVRGNSCIKGIAYAEKECTNPTRIVTSTVEIENGELDVVSVKTEKDIPKEKIYECMGALKGIKVKAPINIGDVIIQNVAETGVDVIATKRVKCVDKDE